MKEEVEMDHCACVYRFFSLCDFVCVFINSQLVLACLNVKLDMPSLEGWL